MEDIPSGPFPWCGLRAANAGMPLLGPRSQRGRIKRALPTWGVGARAGDWTRRPHPAGPDGKKTRRFSPERLPVVGRDGPIPGVETSELVRCPLSRPQGHCESGVPGEGPLSLETHQRLWARQNLSRMPFLGPMPDNCHAASLQVRWGWITNAHLSGRRFHGVARQDMTGSPI